MMVMRPVIAVMPAMARWPAVRRDADGLRAVGGAIVPWASMAGAFGVDREIRPRFER